MAKKKKAKSEEEYSSESEMAESGDEEFDAPVKSKPAQKKQTTLRASEWAKQDPDKPDAHLFLWWDKEGVISEDEYLKIKAQVHKKKR